MGPKTLKSKPEGNIDEDPLDIAIKDVQNGAGLHLDSDEDSGSDDGAESQLVLNKEHSNGRAPMKAAGFLCMESHDGKTQSENPNAETMQKLQKMATSYGRTGDQWRTRAFRQAIGKLRKQGELIRTSHQARAVGIGESIALQIEEIVSTGKYRRLEYAQNDPRNQIVKLFMGVYGAGETTAQKWIAQGYRCLAEVYEKADLNVNQRVGIEHYDDFLQRIPRGEVEQHAAVVEKALKAADPNLQLIIGGSYRRGSKDSGDIDCIIFMPEAGISHIRTLMLDAVIPGLMAQGFLKVVLASGSFSDDGSSKWHGASALPGANVWRRIDFLFVPWAELGAALIYFTGNDLFNRSMRFLAGKKQMRLNQHGLFKDVMRGRGRQRINDGTLIEGHDEKQIFEILGVPYRPPEERNV
ncbi:DNA polymerase IV [Cladophialophora psammophila CBS 110553]|uniref:DNA polymerase n=1 Tax=Cladophialophora psammophila CBS 110553 TaxID=1182543 RepID=W9WJJ6_9EURO|nr:DNA polymerase IV [Cladophialophora psammophila CBS 110553]EXJ68093.1 DNA polymerase IV [Cladophialophora psammophila CBS 110553]